MRLRGYVMRGFQVVGCVACIQAMTWAQSNLAVVMTADLVEHMSPDQVSDMMAAVRMIAWMVVVFVMFEIKFRAWARRLLIHFPRAERLING